MRQPSTASAPGSSSWAPGPSATETVTRPEPGLARGAWEAPPWVFWTLLGAIAVGATLYLLFRFGVLRIRGTGR